MLDQTISKTNFLFPTKNLQAIAKLSQLFNSENPATKLILKNGEELIITEDIYSFLHKIIQKIESGNILHFLPANYQITTDMAANILQISQAELLQLIESKVIPAIHLEAASIISLQDLLDYKIKRDEQREILLDEIMEISQEAGFYE
ncbi:hypothetical protein [Planktothricoides raciborskii]|uniref:DNA-binding protein n=1 Tax=Planktothricoides raciborskii FACHB-1370 TaxID=2949576 RepID=A0ABR8ECB8_9CYAN|nr:hypothetical protein [Planktothricoides raciborskii]MBD2544373.1 hypothetical protein [Planktothricoides raciborskii FACHB-1370]MBD2582220.1 hypothetical protein [Planktothricoides raciborskii FACHB-1261]